VFEFPLQNNLMCANPMTKESSGLSSRTSSCRSIASISSGNSSAMGASLTSEMSRSPSSQFPHSPIDIPPIDPMAVMELEMAAKRVADNVDLLMGNLRSNLHKMSAITVGCLDAYKKSVDTTCDSVDSSIKKRNQETFGQV
uniref:BLOC-1-related complex subunit 6 C-terminal helix domain-containing protein n=1 Tax=Magallana gigas TaxID=29159 RepID=A0A8W8LS73_MAGGI